MGRQEGENQQAGPSGEGVQPEQSSKVLYEIGGKAMCLASLDNQLHPVEIVERKIGDAGTANMYYVHYTDYDKRLDEWVGEDRLKPATEATLQTFPSIAPQLPGEKFVTRRHRREQEERHLISTDLENLNQLDQKLEKEHQEKTKVKNIKMIELGRYEIDTWYWSPYPEPFASQEKLYLCEYCLKYFRKRKTLVNHMAKCTESHPPGDEIYRSPPPSKNRHENGADVVDPPIAVFEVDGKKQKRYCQSLCLLSKLFLDHKTLYYDVDPFLFYVLTEKEGVGYHTVGYFSKEKSSADGYNLACILTLPPYQRKGYGRFLIAFSYELSQRDGKVGTPERPLSDLGMVSYRSFWTKELLETIYTHGPNISIKDLSELTGIRTDDVVSTLQTMNLVRYWKGDHILACVPKTIEDHLRMLQPTQPAIAINRSRVHYTPYLPASASVRPRP